MNIALQSLLRADMRADKDPRPGKSIVELLVCLGIIAFMATLFLGAAMMVLRSAQNLGK